MQQRKYLMTVLQLTLSMLSANILSTLSNFVGIIILSKLGTDYLAASGIISTYQTLILNVSMSLFYSTSVLVAQFYGANMTNNTYYVLKKSLIISSYVSVLVILLFWYSNNIFKPFILNDEILLIIDTYFKIYIYSIFPCMWLTVLQQYAYGILKQSIVIAVNLFGLILTIILGYLFVYGNEHIFISSLKTFGLGLAYVIQMWLRLFTFIIILYKHNKLILKMVFKQKESSVCLPLTKKIITTGWPISLLAATELLIPLVINIMASLFGSSALAAQQIISQLLIIFLLPILSISQVASTISGYAIGKSDINLLKNCIKISLFLAASIAVFLLFITYIFNDRFIKLLIFDKNNTEFINNFYNILYLNLFFFIFESIKNVLIGLLRGMLYTKVPMFINIGCSWLIGIPFAYLVIKVFHGSLFDFNFVYKASSFFCSILLFFYLWKKYFILSRSILKKVI